MEAAPTALIRYINTARTRRRANFAGLRDTEAVRPVLSKSTVTAAAQIGASGADLQAMGAAPTARKRCTKNERRSDDPSI